MRFSSLDWPQGQPMLIRIFAILGLLLIALAVVALLSDVLSLLDRFRPEIYLFLLGALLAYLMAPIVRLFHRLLRVHVAAVLASYLLLFAAVLMFGALLLTPFVSQAQSLVKNMQSPSASTLARLHLVESDLSRIQAALHTQQRVLNSRRPIPADQVRQVQSDTSNVVAAVILLSAPTTEQGVAPIPPSYANPIAAQARQLQTAYGAISAIIDSDHMTRAVAAADAAAGLAASTYQKAASTPLLLLDLQVTLDHHNINVDLHARFSQILQTVSNQVSSLLNNALSISVQAGSLLIDVMLVFIISIYFLRDGSRFLNWLVRQVPAGSRESVGQALTSLDTILGSYLRAQLVLALVAGTADATGALVLGIPYAIVIFFSSFLLSLVPVLGPVVLPVPPMLIALIFSPLPKPVAYLLWLLIGEQLVTNVVGPRLQAHTLRIHPLEAMAAALVGLPLAGLPGAFFAVPVVAFVHIVIRELLSARRGAKAPTPATGTVQVPS